MELVGTRASPAVVVAVAGCLLLLIRSDVARSTGALATPLLVALFAAVLLAGVMPTTAGLDVTAAADPRPVLLIGLLAFAAGRVIGGGHPLLPATGTALALNTFAAIAEEAFFRRLVFGLVAARRGPVAAIAVSATLFALIHVPVYGWWVVPLDLAAGLLLGWQRAATGSWFVPAVTHAAANLMVVL